MGKGENVVSKKEQPFIEIPQNYSPSKSQISDFHDACEFFNVLIDTNRDQLIALRNKLFSNGQFDLFERLGRSIVALQAIASQLEKGESIGHSQIDQVVTRIQRIIVFLEYQITPLTKLEAKRVQINKEFKQLVIEAIRDQDNPSKDAQTLPENQDDKKSDIPTPNQQQEFDDDETTLIKNLIESLNKINNSVIDLSLTLPQYNSKRGKGRKKSVKNEIIKIDDDGWKTYLTDFLFKVNIIYSHLTENTRLELRSEKNKIFSVTIGLLAFICFIRGISLTSSTDQYRYVAQLSEKMQVGASTKDKAFANSKVKNILKSLEIITVTSAGDGNPLVAELISQLAKYKTFLTDYLNSEG